jgi:hypothetical protein
MLFYLFQQDEDSEADMGRAVANAMGFGQAGFL